MTPQGGKRVRPGQNQQMVRKMLEVSPYGIYLLDLQSLRVVDANRMFCRMFDYPSREMVIGCELMKVLNVGSNEIRPKTEIK